jgi:hypothetical protein
MRRLRDWQDRRSREAWEEDKRDARAFVDQQRVDLRPGLRTVVDELIELGETSEPSQTRVRELVEALEELTRSGVEDDVFRLAVVDAAVEYLK